MTDLTILVASMSGTAEFVADELQQALQDRGSTAKIAPLAKLSVERLQALSLALVCSSTYGVGEVPDGAKPFLAKLQAERPSLSGLRYGVVTLGDSKYPATFCGGGLTFDRAFSALGAQRIGEPCRLDASSGKFPEEVALQWLDGWLETAGA